MKPNASLHDPRPEYLRELLDRAGLKQGEAAEAIGVSPRQLRYYLSMANDHQDAPYAVQFALESLARAAGVDDQILLMRAAREADHQAAHRTLAAIIAAAGGELSVKRHHVAGVSARTLIERHDSPGGDWFFKLREG